MTIDARWIGPSEGGASCESHRKSPYHVTLNERDHAFDDEYGTCDFDPQLPSRRIWTGLPPSDEYYLTIWTNNTNPNCCLTGEIDVSQNSKLTGESCTKLPDSTMTMLHDALDLAGLVPALGAIPDGINAGLYLIEGDWAGAGISAAAMIPIFGEGVTLTKMGVKVSRAVVKKVGKEAIEKGLKEAVQEGEKKVVKELAQEGGKKMEKELAQEGGKKAEKELAAEAEKEAAQKTEKEAVKAKPKSPKCTDAVHDAIYNAFKSACLAFRKCSELDSCETATAKVALATACLAGRVKLQQKCYTPTVSRPSANNPVGNKEYGGHMAQIAQMSAALRKCQEAMMEKCVR